MSNLANTTWKLTKDGVPPAQYAAVVAFGPLNAPPGAIGGQGTYQDPQSGSTPFFWVEDSKGGFMFQFQNQDPGYSTLTTYTGTHSDGAATGWSSNFSVGFSSTGFGMVKTS